MRDVAVALRAGEAGLAWMNSPLFEIRTAQYSGSSTYPYSGFDISTFCDLRHHDVRAAAGDPLGVGLLP